MIWYTLILLKDMIEEMGEIKAKNIVAHFSCPRNNDVEDFLKNKAIEFEKQSLSSTHLIFTSYSKKPVLAVYFTLAYKSFTISRTAIHKGKPLSKNKFKSISKFGTYNQLLDFYTIPAPLIAQLGKNYQNNYNNLITRDEILKIACDKIWQIQRILSGKYIYLECEDKPKLIEFYSSNGFVEFGNRALDYDESTLSGEYLVQMLKDLKIQYDKDTY